MSIMDSRSQAEHYNRGDLKIPEIYFPHLDLWVNFGKSQTPWNEIYIYIYAYTHIYIHTRTYIFRYICTNMKILKTWILVKGT